MLQRPGLVFTDVSNITLNASQVESGANASDNPDVTSGAGGPLLAYTASGVSTCCGPPYGLFNLDDGDIGAGIPSDGFYALPFNGDLRLTFDAGAVTLGGIAIYNGYGNRDDGSYTLLDDAGTTLGAWTVSGTGGTTNNGVDSFWLSFNSPVTTTFLTLRATGVETNTPSYREIQVFQTATADPGDVIADAISKIGVLMDDPGTPKKAKGKLKSARKSLKRALKKLERGKIFGFYSNLRNVVGKEILKRGIHRCSLSLCVGWIKNLSKDCA